MRQTNYSVFKSHFAFPFFANAYLACVEFGIAVTFFGGKPESNSLHKQNQKASFNKVYTFEDLRKKILSKTFIIILFRKTVTSASHSQSIVIGESTKRRSVS